MTNMMQTAKKLLQAEAVKLRPAEPYTWASGWKSPIYCDNRRLLSFPYIRDYVKSELCNHIFEAYPDAALIAGVATAGIPWGTMVADQLKLPFVYVRPKPKEHGLGNQVEGFYTAGQRVVIVEDLVSTGKSSLEAAMALQQGGLHVQGLVAIFSYGFREASAAFERFGVPFASLTNYTALLQSAKADGVITEDLEAVLLKWRDDPANWNPLP